jgi:hypothetical protein
MAKQLKYQQVVVAASLLLGVVCMSACLLPQNDEPLPDLPPVRNHAPQIILTQVKPQNQNGVTVDPLGNCDRQTGFQVYVADADLLLDGGAADTLSSAWRGSTLDGLRTTGWVLGRPQTLSPTGMEELRSVPFTDPLPNNFWSKDPLSTPGQRRIDVVVADATFTLAQGDTAMPGIELKHQYPLLDGGTFEEPAGTDSFTWVVNDVGMGQCP